MSEWKKVKIGDFLTEREGRYKPDDSIIVKYQRLDKIDFSGTIHLSNKPTKTDMILVQPGDLVISGINVAKGALTVYQGKEPVCATIHYSSYTFDSSIVNLDYFKLFVKSPAFLEVLKQQVKGGNKTEIKAKHLLSLEIRIPDLPTQNKIVSQLSEKLHNAELIAKEVESQKEYTKQLRQNILQDAIEGKLTADWRKTHKSEKNAEDLLNIVSSKITDKKLKSLPAIISNTMPFEIPSSWKWCRLGEIIETAPRNGYSPKAVDYETPFKTLKLGAVTYGYFDSNEYKYINEEIPSDSYCWLKNGDLLIERSNSIEYVGICAIYTGKDNEFLYPDLLMKFRVSEPILKEYVHTALIAPFNRTYFMSNAKGAQKTMPKINQDCVINTMLPLPPLEEQKEIVACVEAQLQTVTALEKQIAEREQLTKQLMQSILKQAFEEDKNVD